MEGVPRQAVRKRRASGEGMGNMISNKNEKGYSLIELVITAVIGGLLLIGVFTFLGRGTQKAAAYLETSEMDERRNLFGDLIRRDLDNAGSNLLYSPVINGGLVSGLFKENADYAASPGYLTKTGPDGWESGVVLTTSIVSGEGYIEYTPPATGSFVYLCSGYNGSYRLIYLESTDKSGTANIYIMEDGWVVVARPPAHSLGDSYRIAIEPDAVHGRVVNYYRIRNGLRTLIYTSAAPMLIYPITVNANLAGKGSSLTGIQFFASVMTDSTVGGAQLPPLPFDAWTGARLQGAITESTGTPLDAKRAYIIFAGDRNVDPVFTQAALSGADAKIQVNSPARGSFNAGDFVFLVDRSPGVSAAGLFQVQTVSSSPKGFFLEVIPVTKEAPAWGRLYVDESDFNHAFPTGSMLVRLAPPVTYALVSENRILRSESYVAKDKLSRDGGGENSAAALLGVMDFSLTDTSVAASRSYMVALTLTTEGYETGATTQTFTYKATPQALNGAPDWTRLLPQN